MSKRKGFRKVSLARRDNGLYLSFCFSGYELDFVQV